jgi:hypothetical protein
VKVELGVMVEKEAMAERVDLVELGAMAEKEVTAVHLAHLLDMKTTLHH